MKSYRFTRYFVSIAALALMASASATRAAEEAPAPTDIPPLVINNGTLVGFTNQGKPAVATLRNVIDLAVRPQYPDANITIIGVDDVRVGNLKLEWRKSRGEDHIFRSAPLAGVLKALQIASGNKFQVFDSNNSNFLLSPPPDVIEPSRRVEVFNVTELIDGTGPQRAAREGLKSRIWENEIKRKALASRYEEKHPRVVELDNDTANLQAELAALESEDRKQQHFENVDKLLTRVSEVVEDTLQRLQPDEHVPEFKYHDGSRLLVVIGTPEAVEITRKVLAVMPKPLM